MGKRKCHKVEIWVISQKESSTQACFYDQEMNEIDTFSSQPNQINNCQLSKF